MELSMTKDEKKMYDNHNIVVTNKRLITGDATYLISKILSVKTKLKNILDQVPRETLFDKFTDFILRPLTDRMLPNGRKLLVELKQKPFYWELSIVYEKENITIYQSNGFSDDKESIELRNEAEALASVISQLIADNN